MRNALLPLTLAIYSIAAPVALADDLPQPFDIGGGWRSCPTGYLIWRDLCLPAADGPVTEFGCELHENGAGEVLGQICPNDRLAWVGNVGEVGGFVAAPVIGSPVIFGPVGGVGFVAPRGHR